MSPMNPRLLRPRASGDPDALRYIAAVQAADGQTLEPAVAKAISDFVVGCKLDGIWSAIGSSCILMGARTLNGIMTPLKGTAPTSNAFDGSTDYTRKTGLVGNGSTKYLNTNRLGTDDGQNDAHMAVYVSADATNATFPAYMGYGQAEISSDNTFMYRLSTTGNHFASVRSSGQAPNIGVTAAITGLYGASRQASTSFSIRAAGANTPITNNQSQTRRALNYYVLAVNNGSNAPTFFSNARLAFYSIGSGLDLALLDTRVSALYTAIGAAI